MDVGVVPKLYYSFQLCTQTVLQFLFVHQTVLQFLFVHPNCNTVFVYAPNCITVFSCAPKLYYSFWLLCKTVLQFAVLYPNCITVFVVVCTSKVNCCLFVVRCGWQQSDRVYVQQWATETGTMLTCDAVQVAWDDVEEQQAEDWLCDHPIRICFTNGCVFHLLLHLCP
jgi:hypothetical protein